MDEKKTAPPKRVLRRLYSLYPEQVQKLEQLAKLRKMPQSQYLREIIEVAYAAAFAQADKRAVTYGVD